MAKLPKTRELLEEWLEARNDGDIEPEVISEVPQDVFVDFLHKTRYGLWKDIDASDLGTERHRHKYGSGKSFTCSHCNTAFKTHLKNPECPFCHKKT